MINHYNCIYMYTNLINGKRYVGKAKDFNKRHNQHLKGKEHLIDKKIKEYGIENFKVEILIENAQNDDKLNEYEKFFIKRKRSHVSYGTGYNKTWGGDGGDTLTYMDKNKKEAYSAKQSKLSKERWTNNEYRDRMKKIQKIAWDNEERRIECSSKTKKMWEEDGRKQKQSELTKERWKDEKFKDEHCARMKKMWMEDEYRAMMMDCRKDMYSRDDYREKRSDISKKMWQNEEHREYMSTTMKNKWEQDDTYREKVSQAVRDAWDNEELKAEQSKRSKENWKNEAYRQNIIDKQKELWEDEEYRRMMSEKRKAMWKNEEYRKKVIKRGGDHPSAKKVVCLETKQVFGTIKEASKWCHGNIKAYFAGATKSAGKHPETGEKLHWMLYEDYILQHGGLE